MGGRHGTSRHVNEIYMPREMKEQRKVTIKNHGKTKLLNMVNNFI
jgi:hypothetical protein